MTLITMTLLSETIEQTTAKSKNPKRRKTTTSTKSISGNCRLPSAVPDLIVLHVQTADELVPVVEPLDFDDVPRASTRREKKTRRVGRRGRKAYVESTGSSSCDEGDYYPLSSIYLRVADSGGTGARRPKKGAKKDGKARLGKAAGRKNNSKRKAKEAEEEREPKEGRNDDGNSTQE